MIGKTLNHYRIREKLGAGGMGEVYLAEDTRLGREVAIKVLPRQMASDQELRVRFEREARVIAALNHPNIVTLHSIERSDDLHFITMEFVRGRTLLKAMPRRGMDLRELLDLGLSMTGAMAAAHEKEITHRDLKPENIMIGDDGRLRILDFGLAKLKEELSYRLAGSDDPTQFATTETGRVLGTVAYMSPEQAQGKTVDSRSDVFSLGIILYEMATGQRPFQGDNKASIISAILRDTPVPVTEINQSLPRHLGRIVKRCLVKDPGRRYPDARELYNELLELKEEIDSGEVLPSGSLQAVREPGRKPAVPYVTAGILVALAAAAAIYFIGFRNRIGALLAPMESSVTQVTFGSGWESNPSLSPDGRMIVYASRESGNMDIYLQRVGGHKIINLTGDSGENDYHPAYSLDGERIAFRSERAGGGIFLMGATGESVRRLTDEGFHPAWSPDGTTILYSTVGFIDPDSRQGVSQLWAVEVATGEKRPIPVPGDAIQGTWSPHGLRIAYWGVWEGSGQRDIWTVPAAGGEPVEVTNDAATDWNPVWSPDGNFIYFISDRRGVMNLFRIPIDEETGEVRGAPQPVTAGVEPCGFLTLSKDGRRIAYMVVAGRAGLQRVSFDPRTGTVQGEPTAVTRRSELLITPSISPDGEWIAFSPWSQQEDLYLLRTDESERRQLTDDPAKDRFPTWSPTGERIAFYSDRSGSYDIWSVQPDGSDLRQITDTPGRELTGPVWSPGGDWIAAVLDDATTLLFDPRVAWADQTAEILPPWSPEGGVFYVYSWSPDGRWLGGITMTSAGEFSGYAVYSLDSRGYVFLTEGEPFTEFAGGPFWLGNDRRLVLSNRRSIFLVDRETGRSREIYSAAPNDLHLAGVSADGRTIYFIRKTFQSDIWLLEF